MVISFSGIESLRKKVQRYPKVHYQKPANAWQSTPCRASGANPTHGEAGGCLGACQDQEPCGEDKLLCRQEGASASSISWLRIPLALICSRSWQPEACSAASSLWLPRSPELTCALGVGGPGPNTETFHSQLLCERQSHCVTSCCWDVPVRSL